MKMRRKGNLLFDVSPMSEFNQSFNRRLLRKVVELEFQIAFFPGMRALKISHPSDPVALRVARRLRRRQTCL